MKKFVIAAVIAVMMTSFPFAHAAAQTSESGSSDGAAMVVDFFAARPLGLASTVFGAATFVVSLPFSALGKNVDQSFDLLVVEPARYTFDRPLGAFD